MAAEQSDTPDAAGRWLPVADAAPSLGTTERTLRRRVLAGQVRHRRRDGRTEVWVAGHVPDADGDSDIAPDENREPPDALMTLLREQIEARTRAEQAASMYLERSRNLEAEVGRLVGQVEQLLALPAHEPPPKPWWRRLTGR